METPLANPTTAGQARPRRPPPPLVLEALALAVVGLAWAARELFDPWLGDHLPYVTFFVAVAAAAWLGGWRPALLATLVGFVLALYHFVPPRGTFAAGPGPHQFGVGMYFMVCLAFGAFGETLHLARRRGEERRAELRARETELAAELADSRLLQRLSAELIQEEDIAGLYQKVLDAAATLMRSDFASLQMLRPERGELLLLAARGFNRQAEQYWQWVQPDSSSSCAGAWQAGARVIVPDVEANARIASSPELEVFRSTGIRAVQSTPLLSRRGDLVGMISTHWSRPHEPAEHELRLFDILARQAADLIERRAAEDALRAADRRKDEFLATLAHELRNPLAPVRYAVRVLQIQGPGTPELEWARNVIDRQVEGMTHLIDDLMDVSRISRNKIELRRRRVDLAQVLHHAVETSRPLIERRGHRLELDLPAEPVTLDADFTRLAQVFANLLNNAAKFTERGGRIELRAAREDHEVRIAVRDNGIGLTAEELPAVFELFAQGRRPPEQAPGGLGIGLSLARQLVEMHGGTIAAASAGRGAGSEFTVWLPVLLDAAAPVTAADAERALAPTNLRVLVVDDNPDAAGTLAMLLRLSGNEVRTAGDGEEAVRVAAEFRPQVALLDIGMPRMDGYEVARVIRNAAWGQQVVLVAVTGWGQLDDRRRSAAAGFDRHMVKPVDPAQLMDLLSGLEARWREAAVSAQPPATT